MIPVELTVRNFLSYGDAPVTLDFTGFHVACLTGDNGHGKSALLDAITYALWGQARKGRRDRKPDEGLLRLGADEMQVEFTFELDDRRFRVLRGFRRRRRSFTSELELQAWSPGDGTYRPLSDGAAMTRTQESIDQLLAMDYETFINSAFILQGRSDEFTRRSARDRKSILGEILGLSRYDRLQEGARVRLSEQEKLIDALLRRCGEADTQLAGRDDWQARLTQIESGLADATRQLTAAETRLEEAGRALTEIGVRRRRLTEAEANAAQLAEQARELDTRRRQLADERDRHIAIVDGAAQTEARFAAYERHTEEAAQMNARLAQVRDLELTMGRLEGEVREVRHRVGAEVAACKSRREEILSQLAGAEDLLARGDEIGAARQRLTASRRDESRLLETQESHRALSQRRLQLEHEIQVERNRLEERRQMISERRGELDRAEAARTALQSQLTEWETRAGLAGADAERLEALRARGTGLRVRLGEIEAGRRRLGAERRELEGRLEALSASKAAACPLCGTTLDREHRAQLDAELSADRERRTRDLEALDGQRESTEAELQRLREEYRLSERAAGDVGYCREELSRLQSRLDQLDEMRQQAQRLAVESADIVSRLAAGAFASQVRTALEALSAEEAALGYDPDALRRAREAVREHADAEARWAQLEQAREQAERGRVALTGIDERLAQLEVALHQDAAEQEKRLAELRDRAAAIGYSAEGHAAVRASVEDLADSPAQFAALQEALLRQDSVREAMGRLAVEEGRVARQTAEIAGTIAALRVESQGDAEATQMVETLRREVAAARGRREDLLQTAGSTRARCEQLDELMAQRRELASQLHESERQAWIYRQLSQAFGKDGIQALAIEGAIPEIEDEANHLLKRLTDNRIQISIESLRDLKGGGTRETLDIQIADEMGVRSYSMYSGGEAFRTDFALRIALSRVLARRAGTQLRTLIIDEGFGTQDSHGLEQLKEAIQEISGDFDKLLVVTHLPELKDAFPVQIEVTKDPELGSQLQVIDLR